MENTYETKNNKNLYVPTIGADSWQVFLADPSKQWRIGYSARTLAYCWENANGFPKEVQAALNTVEEFQDLQLLLAIPEYKVDLPPSGAMASQNDLFVLGKSNTSKELASIMIEGKVAEPFGQTLQQWSQNLTSGKQTRLDFLKKQLRLDKNIDPTIRYQLLHRTVSAISIPSPIRQPLSRRIRFECHPKRLIAAKCEKLNADRADAEAN